MNVPTNLILAGSVLRLCHERRKQVNRTPEALVVSGTRNGFLSLANTMLYTINQLDEVLALDELPFISGDAIFHVRLDESVPHTSAAYPPVIRTDSGRFEWTLPEATFLDVVASIHSLGYANSEVHFDRGVAPTAISLYCVVE